MKVFRVWKYMMALAIVGCLGVATGQAQTTNVLSELDITLKGKLTPDKTAVTGESLSGNTNNISILRIQIIDAGVTNHTTVIGQVVGSNVVSLLEQIGIVDLTPTAMTSDKALGVFAGSAGTASNAVLFLSIAEKGSGSNETATAKFQGIWSDGADAVSGTIASIKVKK